MTNWRGTRAIVDLEAIRHNCRALGGLLSEGTEHCAVVKANAYGHGDVEVARACLEAGVDRVAVSLVEEGVRLREGGIDEPILLLVEPSPAAAIDVVSYDLTPSVATVAAAEAISLAAGERTVGVHVIVDTGMHREGASTDDVVGLVRKIAALDRIEVEGIWSHLAVADEERNPATDRQIERFADVCARLADEGIEPPVRHLANSPALLSRPDAHFDLVRAGIATYGLAPASWLAGRVELRPAMTVVSEVGSVRRVPAGEGISYGLTYAPHREATVATVLLGYADGFTRLLSNTGEVLIGGKRRRVAGRVTMDQITVDCGDDEVRVGDEVVVIGSQGTEEITADDIADRLGTINYEVVCMVSSRVPRVWVG